MSYQSIKERSENNEQGFTLIEILVVILIIGILASIAIPVFLNQRKTANDAAVESDVVNTAKLIETYFVNNPKLTAIDANHVRTVGKKSEGVSLTIYGTRDDYCITGVHTNGKKYAPITWEQNGNQRPYYLYTSRNGGNEQANIGISATSITCDDSGASFSWS